VARNVNLHHLKKRERLTKEPNVIRAELLNADGKPKYKWLKQRVVNVNDVVGADILVDFSFTTKTHQKKSSV
jgi:hypothetical protein